MRVDTQESSFTQGHCRRVAALAVEIARRAGISALLVDQLEQAARLHHSADAVASPAPLARLVQKVLGGHTGDAGLAAPPVRTDAALVLSLFHRRSVAGATGDQRKLAGILRLCNFVDEQFESLEFEHRDVDTVLEEVKSFAPFEDFDPELVERLREIRCRGILEGLRDGSRQLPVETGTARHVFQVLGAPRDYEVAELESVAARDPVLAASMIQVANSALFGRSQTISTVRAAISHVGSVTARNVLMAAALRPVFASAGLTRIWSHSLAAAQFCSALAAQTGVTSAEEGMLLGLVHDLGSLAIQFASHETAGAYTGLIQRGCPLTYAEGLLFGCDHGEIGAEILAQWDFPDHLVEAVRFHHQPERSGSVLVAFAHLAEFWSGLDEDLPSFNRVDLCMARTGLSFDALTQIGTRDSVLSALRSVA